MFSDRTFRYFSVYTFYWVAGGNLFLTVCCCQEDTKNVDSDGRFGHCLVKIHFVRLTDEM